MRTVGIVAEYNPFHKGHAWQLREAKRLSGADAAVVVMSTAFTQRGEPAILQPRVRVRAALEGGADVVVALPALWTVRPAETFAEAGIHLLDSLGVDALSFGAETADLPALMHAAELLEHPDPASSSKLKEALDAGLPYPQALAASVADEALHTVLASPNNTLGICYLRALLRRESRMEIFPVSRQGSYHATRMEVMPSASAVRRAIRSGSWHDVRQAVQDDAIIREEAAQGRVIQDAALDKALLYRLRSMNAEELANLPDLSEGIECRLHDAARMTAAREELLQACKTRRYPYARLSRLAASALLGITNRDWQEPLPDCAILLGFRKDRQAVLKQLSARFPLSAPVPKANSRWMQLEENAWDIQALAINRPCGQLYREKMVVL